MGLLCSCTKRRKKNIILLLVGLDNAGKTVTANRLVNKMDTSTIPTVGFSVLSTMFQRYCVKIYDLGGGPGIRKIWRTYYADVHGVIFVVDSSDNVRQNEAAENLKEILMSKSITGKPLLILANKQDLDGALDEIGIIEMLNLEYIVNRYECPTMVQCCIAQSNANDERIKTGYCWLLTYISQNYEKLNARVQYDLQQQQNRKQELRKKNAIVPASSSEEISITNKKITTTSNGYSLSALKRYAWKTNKISPVNPDSEYPPNIQNNININNMHKTAIINIRPHSVQFINKQKTEARVRPKSAGFIF